MLWTRVSALIGSICVTVACTATQQTSEPGMSINAANSDIKKSSSGVDAYTLLTKEDAEAALETSVKK
jgi:hypothetical protein